MQIEMQTFDALPCELATFKINGLPAYQDDFGETYDHDCASAEPYGCGCMCFDRKPATKKVLNKYRITALVVG